jgi:hypothetical protein
MCKMKNVITMPVLVRPPEVREHPWAHALRCPSFKRTYWSRNLRYNIKTSVISHVLPFLTSTGFLRRYNSVSSLTNNIVVQNKNKMMNKQCCTCDTISSMFLPCVCVCVILSVSLYLGWAVL